MARTQKTYIAFFDLLGVSSLAAHDPDNYYDSLAILREAVSESCYKLFSNGQIYFFSDCAYVQSSQLTSLTEFLRKVRRVLSLKGYFFRGAISTGSLQEENVLQEKKYIKDGDALSKRKRTLYGFSFGSDVVKLYQQEMFLKGVGIWVDPQLDKNWIAKECVVSCHIPQMNNRKAVCFYDIKFNKHDFDAIGSLRHIFQNFLKANTQSKKLGRYYIPFLVNWMQSIEFANIKKGDSAGWENETIPEILYLMFTGKLQNMFSDVVGMEYIYYTTLNKAYNDCMDINTVNEIASYIIKQKTIRKYFENIPNEILCERNKSRFLSEFSIKEIEKHI